jgi:hypothetical protein
LFQHMVEEADPGRNLLLAGSVQAYGGLDPGFLGIPLDRRLAHRVALLRRHQKGLSAPVSSKFRSRTEDQRNRGCPARGDGTATNALIVWSCAQRFLCSLFVPNRISRYGAKHHLK